MECAGISDKKGTAVCCSDSRTFEERTKGKPAVTGDNETLSVEKLSNWTPTRPGTSPSSIATRESDPGKPLQIPSRPPTISALKTTLPSSLMRGVSSSSSKFAPSVPGASMFVFATMEYWRTWASAELRKIPASNIALIRTTKRNHARSLFIANEWKTEDGKSKKVTWSTLFEIR